MSGKAESGKPKAEGVNPNEGDNKRGRPRGSKTKRLPAADVSPSRCPKCGSTRRAPLPRQPPRGEPLRGVCR